MISNNEIEVDLLFKQLVILPEKDKTDQLNDTKEKSRSAAAPENYIDKIATAPPTVEEPNKTKQNKSFILLTNPDIKQSLIAPDSNFRKIITNQNIGNVLHHIADNMELNEDLKTFECIWTIGLNPAQEQQLLNLKHPNILLSTNVEKLTSKQEKLAMFEPFTQFVNANLKLLSQI